MGMIYTNTLFSQVVFVAAMDEVALSGALAMGFEEMGVRFTGAGWMATQMCNDLVRSNGVQQVIP